MIYSIIDVETTGTTNRITEISIFKYDGTQIIDEFTSLVNPQIQIPHYITALTGIDNLMVSDAPTFSEISEDILKITADTIFVAHNVNFDYNIIRNEFKTIEIDFSRKKLCTVRLSRKLLPGHSSYSLGKLCKSLNIALTNRHRAKGDAQATVILFEQLLEKDSKKEVINTFLNKNSKEATLPSHLPTSEFNTLPHGPGIYYFKDKKGKPIYVGKAKNLRKRVLSHFYSKSKKSLEMCRETRHIDFELSGSELIALLMEDAAIKHHYPKFNSQSKRRTKSYGIFSYLDRSGIRHLAYNVLNTTTTPLIVFNSIRECRSFLESICLQYNLCPKYCHLQEGVNQCSHYTIKCCKGICTQDESVLEYNKRVKTFINSISEKEEIELLKYSGRHRDESSFVLILNGIYKGYGFIDKSEQINAIEELDHFLIRQKDTIDTQRILRPYLTQNSQTINSPFQKKSSKVTS